MLAFFETFRLPFPAGARSVRLALPTAAALVLALLALHLWPQGAPDEPPPAPADARILDRMEDAILTRADSQGRLFTVSAAEATRADSDSDTVSLTRVRAQAAFDSPFRADDRLSLTAASALLRGADERLDLFAPLTLTTDSAYRLQAEWLGIDLRASRIEEGRGVSLTGPDAALRSDSMSTSADGNRLTFRGNVRVRLPSAPPPTTPSGDGA